MKKILVPLLMLVSSSLMATACLEALEIPATALDFGLHWVLAGCWCCRNTCSMSLPPDSDMALIVARRWPRFTWRVASFASRLFLTVCSENV